MQFKHFTLHELKAHPISKDELLTLVGLSGNLLQKGIWFDYALPQEWVESFLTHCKVNNLSINYNLIISTTFWVYVKKNPFGYAISGCSEVQWAIEAFTKESNL